MPASVSANPAAPTLSDGVVVLRAVTPHDIPAIVEQSTDAETVRWTTLWEGYTRDDARQFVERVAQEWATGERHTWAVELGGRFTGLAGYRPRGDRAVEVSFASHPDGRGQGVTTRAVGLAVRHGFDSGADVAFWHALVGNFGSRKVAWRLGFSITGPVSNVVDGAVRDFWAGRLLRAEAMRPRHRWLSAPDLVGDGIRVREFRDADEARFPVEHDPLTAAFSGGLPTRDGYASWLLERRTRAAEGGALCCAVADAVTDQLLGGVDVSRLGVPLLAGTGILGFWLLPDARGRGVLGRTLETFLPWTLRPTRNDGLGLHRLSAGCVTENLASGRVLRRAGFQLVGTERRALQSGGTARDELLFDLLDTDDRDAQRMQPGRVAVVETEHYRLRPWRDSDVPGPDEGPDDASLLFMPTGVHPDADSYVTWLAKRRLRVDEGWGLDWCIADRADDHAVGNLTIFAMGAPRGRFQGEIGYWLHPPARGRGVLGEALPPLLDHAFATLDDSGLGLTRLHAATDADNLASQSVLLRAGFRETARERQSYRNGFDDLVDGVIFELLASDDRRDRRPHSIVPVRLDGLDVRLRPWREEDAARVVQACVDPQTRYWLAGMPQPYTPDTARAYIHRCQDQARAGTGCYLAMADMVDDTCVGSVAVMGLTGQPPDDPLTGEVGYWVHPAARGRGSMTQAVRLLVAYAFRRQDAGGLGLRRLVLRAAEGNLASQHVARSAGFEQVGVGRLAEQLGDGSYVDLVEFDLVNPDWQSEQATATHP